MNIELINYLKELLSKNNLDGIIINSTNEFLVEYNELEQNSRYHLTGFSGSTGDVLFTQEKIYQFVDPRYHEQADNEVDHDYVEVVKIPLGQSYISSLFEHIPAYSKIGIIEKKISKKFIDILSEKLKDKISVLKPVFSDPVEDFINTSKTERNYNIFDVPIEIAQITPDEKLEMIKEYAGDTFIIVVTSLEDIAYITNKRSYDFPYSAVFPAKAILTEKGAKIYTDCKPSFIGNKFEIHPFSEFEQDLKAINSSEIYIDETQISAYDYNLIDKSNKILESRLKLIKTVKNTSELEHMKKCFERADEALKVILDMINSDTIYSEYDYAQALIKSMKENGALSLSFSPIVAAGSNSSIIHYKDSSKEKMVQDGDFLLIDYGGYYEGGIATDTTRTFIKGEPSAEQKTAYTAVLKAFFAAYSNKYTKKSSYFDIDKMARDTISKTADEGWNFSHSTGHGVGIGVHENPPVVSSSDISKTKIIENSTFSIEPGVYKEGIGGVRLENTVYASYTDDGIQINSFSHFPFEIKLVDISALTEQEKLYFMKWQAESCIQ